MTDPVLRRSLRWLRDSEELVDMDGGHYLEREVWDRGYVDHYDDVASKFGGNAGVCRPV